PYIILKWAQTADGKIAHLNPPEGRTSGDSVVGRLLISNEYTNRLVHKWRSEEAAILIGTNTAMLDNPELTTRLWPGPSPVRLVMDMDLRLPVSLKVFNGEVRTIIFNSVRQEEKGNLVYYKLANGKNLTQELINALYQLKIQTVLVEGGAKLLQSFIDERIWDEVRIIKNEGLINKNGLNAPVLNGSKDIYEQKFLSDTIEIYKPKHS
ncbi:MAG: RibD family protein, partial [Chitinophagaceae bacterium]